MQPSYVYSRALAIKRAHPHSIMILSPRSTFICFLMILSLWSVIVLPAAARLQDSRLWPAAIPLAVRSPYLSSWMPAVNDTSPPHEWPTFSNRKRVLGWVGYVRVDGSNWRWLSTLDGGGGAPSNATAITNIEITPTRSIFTCQAGPMAITITFLSPIEPSDLVMQSFPFAYVSLEASSTDGNSHSVEVYSDISGEWASADNGNGIEWNLTTTATSVYHTVHRAVPLSMTEVNGMAEDSQVYIGMGSRSGLTWQSGKDADLRNSFANSGKLTNTPDTKFRPVDGRPSRFDFPVFAISVDLGTFTSILSPVVWCIGLLRDPTITSWNGTSHDDRHPYFKTRYQNISTAIDAFLLDYPNALDRAVLLDDRLTSEAKKVSNQYADLVSLATRQTLGGLEFTTSKMPDGSYAPSDLQIFMKDIGSNGQTSRMNPVEGIYAAFPALLYLNSTWASSILLPHLKYHNGSQDAISYVAPDLGPFPVSQPMSRQDLRGVEDTSSMLIMVYAHALISGDGSLIAKYYPLLRRWGDYLSNHAMNPTNQLTADGAQAGTSVNLMLKGIIGIQAMAGISQAFGDSTVSRTYNDRAQNFISQWKGQAMQNGHLVWDISDAQSWGMVYNAFADKLIRSNLIGQATYDSQAVFYAQLANNSTDPFGLPLTSGLESPLARSDWTMLTASTIGNSSTRDALLSMVHARASFNGTIGAFPTTYNATSGNEASGIASPAQGAVYSLLSLRLQPQTITIPTPVAPVAVGNKTQGGLSGGKIAGIVISAVAALIFPVLAFLWYRRRSHSLAAEGRVSTPFVEIGERPAIFQLVSDKQQRLVTEKALPAPPILSTPVTSPQPVSTEPRVASVLDAEQLNRAVDDLRREFVLMRGGYVEPPPY